MGIYMGFMTLRWNSSLHWDEDSPIWNECYKKKNPQSSNPNIPNVVLIFHTFSGFLLYFVWNQLNFMSVIHCSLIVSWGRISNHITSFTEFCHNHSIRQIYSMVCMVWSWIFYGCVPIYCQGGGVSNKPPWLQEATKPD